MIAKRFSGLTLALSLLACAAQEAPAATIEDVLPRGEAVCYGAAPATHPVFRLVRVTRPERFQPYDSAGARMVRVVLNFKSPDARLEDTASCRLRGGQVVCVSTSCEGTEFRLTQEGGTFRILFEPAAPKALWSCSEPPLRALAMSDRDRSLSVTRSKGACLE